MSRSGPTKLYPGFRVGTVELVSEIEPRVTPSGRTIPQWEVLCDCGGRAYRTSWYLVQAFKRGYDTSCYACKLEASKGTFINRLVSTKKYFLKLFQRTGRLYPPARPEVKYDPAWNPEAIDLDRFSLGTYPYETDEGSNIDYPQQDQWIFPIESNAGLICYYCGKPFTKGTGCVRCLTRICNNCAPKVAHRCPLDWMTTWQNESKDSGLLTRRLNLLTSKPLVLVTQELVEKAQDSHLKEYKSWLEKHQRSQFELEQKKEAAARVEKWALKKAQREKRARILGVKKALKKARREERARLSAQAKKEKHLATQAKKKEILTARAKKKEPRTTQAKKVKPLASQAKKEKRLAARAKKKELLAMEYLHLSKLRARRKSTLLDIQPR